MFIYLYFDIFQEMQQKKLKIKIQNGEKRKNATSFKMWMNLL